MTKVGESYTKLISTFYTKAPDNILYQDQYYTVQITWKIGNRSEHDKTKEELIKEHEAVGIIDVNQH